MSFFDPRSNTDVAMSWEDDHFTSMRTIRLLYVPRGGWGRYGASVRISHEEIYNGCSPNVLDNARDMLVASLEAMFEDGGPPFIEREFETWSRRRML